MDQSKVKKLLEESLNQGFENDMDGRGEWLIGPNDEAQVYYKDGVLSVRWSGDELSPMVG